MSLRGSSRKSRTILTQKKDLMNDPGATAQLNDTNKAKEDQTGTVKKVTTHKKAAYLQSLNESEKAANFKIIDNMNKRINFLRNPRFKTTKAPFTLNKVREVIIIIFRNLLAQSKTKITHSQWSQEKLCS